MRNTEKSFLLTFELLLKAGAAQGKQKAVSLKAGAVRQLKGDVAELALWDDDDDECHFTEL